MVDGGRKDFLANMAAASGARIWQQQAPHQCPLVQWCSKRYMRRHMRRQQEVHVLHYLDKHGELVWLEVVI